MKTPFFQLGAAFAGVVLFSFLVFEGEDVSHDLGFVEEDEPVLIFEIPHSEHLAKIRRAIADDRKPNHNRGEQMFLLQAVRDGLEI